ncbi:MAG: DUF3568 family protein [Candidatus Omnitrophica bacterium]|nr:DUF3568 family protein [Candidatus Omnitrophota bacterium]
MFKKMVLFISLGMLLVSISGCIALLAGGAAGGGTAIWLSNKLTQEFNAPYEQAINAAKEALRSFNLEITKESKEADVAQIKSKYTDGKEIWVDIRKITERSTKVEVRVGAVKPDKEAAAKILKRIGRYL